MKQAIRKAAWPVGTCGFYLVLIAFLYFSIRGDLRDNGEKTMVNRTVGYKLADELADLRRRSDDQVARSRDTNATVRAIAAKLGILPATRPATP